ncbi:MAG TPA: hypothetical protein VF458_24105 [Ktedonobacteraceae bacterium]
MLLLNLRDGLVEGMFQLLEIIRAIGNLHQRLRDLLLGGPVEREARRDRLALPPAQRGSVEVELLLIQAEPGRILGAERVGFEIEDLQPGCILDERKCKMYICSTGVCKSK